MKKIIVACFALFLTSCASIPAESVILADAVVTEGRRMHELNISLLNKIFTDKRLLIDEFIKNKFTQDVITNYKAKYAADYDFNKDFAFHMELAVEEITAQRNLMQSALETQRIKLIEKLNKDFMAYEQASNSLRLLLQSSVDLDRERRAALDKANSLTGNHIDFDKVESDIDNFILKAGENAANTMQSVNELNTNINQLINK